MGEGFFKYARNNKGVLYHYLFKGIVDIQFINPFDNVRFEEGDVYQMVESTSYFEAYRHVLKGLQEISPAELPFKVTNDFSSSCFHVYIFFVVIFMYI